MSISSSQLAIEIASAGGPEVLKLIEHPIPEPGSRQVLIKVAAAGVNRHDCHQRANGTRHDGSGVPGLEVSGEVVGLGQQTTGLSLGDKVMALTQGGGYAQFVVADEALVMPKPEAMTFVEAAGVPEALFTSWWNFFGLMKFEPGEYALIHGGTSGVGHLALQAMSALGLKVFATAGSDEKVAAAKGFGAAAAFRYDDPDLAEKVLDASDGQGIGALLDMSAGAHLDQDLEMMAPDGRIAHLSGGGGKHLSVPLSKLMAKRIRIMGSLLRPLPLPMKASTAERIRRDVFPLLGKRVRPVVAHEFPLADAASAHREMEKNATVGKLVLTVA